jgi:AraC family transcriptional regulator of arabinose operon
VIEKQRNADSDVNSDVVSQGAGARVKAAQRSSSSLGALNGQIPDHLYALQGGRLIYTAPWVHEELMRRCSASILVTASAAPIQVTAGDSTGLYNACGIKPMVLRRVRYDNIPALAFQFDPSHPLFPRFRRIASPGVLPLDRKPFDAFNEQLYAAYYGKLTSAQAGELFESFTATAMRYFPRAKPIDKRVQQTIDLLWQRYDISLSELASQVGLSYFRLSHLFTENMGMTLRHYQQWRKIRKAISLSKHGNLSLAQLAVASGFTDAAHFSKAFVQLHAAPPSYFLNNANVKIISPTSAS